MFNLLKKKLYMILAIVFCILSVVLTFNYVIIERTMRNDYIKKVEDIARKHIEDFNVKMDYVENITSVFLNNLQLKYGGNIPFDNFNIEVSSIKIYSNDIDGVGIFLDDGRKVVSKSMYLQYQEIFFEKIREDISSFWYIETQNNGEEQKLYFVMPFKHGENIGYVIADAGKLRKNFSPDGVFMKQSLISLENEYGRFIIYDEGNNNKINISKQLDNGINVKVFVQDAALKNRLRIALIAIICFGLLVMFIAVIAARNIINSIISEMEKLKQEIDTYASQK
ncbi:MAG: hypothetical protein PUE13_04950 [Clostridiales bacterium]|nr:hypothetical protein [Clostridiales bacterium]